MCWFYYIYAETKNHTKFTPKASFRVFALASL